MTSDNNFKKLLLAGMISVALGACGGGDGGIGTGDVIIGGGDEPPAIVNVSGTFVDSPVNGLAYTCSPSGTTGVTGDNGTAGGFTCVDGDTVTFSVGGITLGSSQGVVSNGGVITPAELAGDRNNPSNARAVRIARFLQSLDDDGNSDNGIVINTAAGTAISGLDSTTRDNMLAALISGTNFDTVFGTIIDDVTAGNSVPRIEGDLVTAVDAEIELTAAVNTATGGGTGTSSAIVAHPTGVCPLGELASARSPEIFGQTFPVCAITNRIEDDVTLTNDHIYVLQREVLVGDGERVGGPTGTKNAVLTVEPGTMIFGYDGIKASLVVTRGSRLIAQGTPDLPIIMAAVQATGTDQSLVITDDPTDLTSRGQWGGLVLSGRGINNACTDGEISAEAVENIDSRKFGCNNNADSSGTIEYVIIAESGLLFRPNQEVQGLTIEGGGSNTRINYLQILGSEDDGIEWFGGAASISNVVINGADDDALDWDEGFVGTIQNALVIFGYNEGDKGIEPDTAGPSNDAEPVSRPNILNLTMIGDRGKGSSVGIHYKVGTGGAMWRSAIVDYGSAYVDGTNPASTGLFAGGCIDIDDQIDTSIAFRDVIMDCANGTTGDWGFGLVSDGDTYTQDFFTGGLDESGAAVSAARRDVEPLTGTISPTTLAIINQGTSPNNEVAPPAGVNGNPVGNYFGAVDPAAADPDNNPTNGGPFWDGWTYRNAAVQGNLPPVNGSANFHPLAEEIAAGVTQ